MNLLLLLLITLITPSLIMANEPSSGTLIMISSIGVWVLAAAAFVGMRRYRRARQQQRD